MGGTPTTLWADFRNGWAGQGDHQFRARSRQPKARATAPGWSTTRLSGLAIGWLAETCISIVAFPWCLPRQQSWRTRRNSGGRAGTLGVCPLASVSFPRSRLHFNKARP